MRSFTLSEIGITESVFLILWAGQPERHLWWRQWGTREKWSRHSQFCLASPSSLYTGRQPKYTGHWNKFGESTDEENESLDGCEPSNEHTVCWWELSLQCCSQAQRGQLYTCLLVLNWTWIEKNIVLQKTKYIACARASFWMVSRSGLWGQCVGWKRHVSLTAKTMHARPENNTVIIIIVHTALFFVTHWLWPCMQT